MKGREIDGRDLYAEGLDPVIGERDRAEYHDTTVDRMRVSSRVDHLLVADALVFGNPVGHERFPAIPKGFFDRGVIPGVSFDWTRVGIRHAS
jgi:NAD(P)H dehydrogenase (quinone)